LATRHDYQVLRYVCRIRREPVFDYLKQFQDVRLHLLLLACFNKHAHVIPVLIGRCWGPIRIGRFLRELQGAPRTEAAELLLR